MQDAVVLANCLRDLESSSPEAIHACFADFREQRFAHVKEQYEASQMNAKLIYGQVKKKNALCPTFTYFFILQANVCHNVDSCGKGIAIHGLQLDATLGHAQGRRQELVVPTSGHVPALARGSRNTRAAASEALQEGTGGSAPNVCCLNWRGFFLWCDK